MGPRGGKRGIGESSWLLRRTATSNAAPISNTSNTSSSRGGERRRLGCGCVHGQFRRQKEFQSPQINVLANEMLQHCLRVRHSSHRSQEVVKQPDLLVFNLLRFLFLLLLIRLLLSHYPQSLVPHFWATNPFVSIFLFFFAVVGSSSGGGCGCGKWKRFYVVPPRCAPLRHELRSGQQQPQQRGGGVQSAGDHPSAQGECENDDGAWP
mmetsp:Transcript_87535/g.169597  ORF Transcript_87535/g.169597 Transcript_87535/m.169597 type:complete len:208 (+) Transcript_87535:458-1081(+)